MADESFHLPTATPPLSWEPEPAESLWSIRVKNIDWSAELRLHGKSWVWEARLFRSGELISGHPFLLRDQAVKWATERKGDIEHGWI